jgi:hypothetical protein
VSDPTHPNFGREIRIAQHGNEIHLIFVAGTRAQADSVYENLFSQLQAGELNISMKSDKPRSVTEL